MERVQPEPPRVDAPEGEKVPKERDPTRLPALISAVQATHIESERYGFAHQINELLIAMRAPGNESAEAKVVLEALDLEHLSGLVDQQGRSCRAEAVDTLVACGFPHALSVRPEDLAHREEHRAQGKSSVKQWVLGLVSLAGVLLGVLTALGNFWLALTTVLVGLPILALLIVIVVRNPSLKGSSFFD
jgi:hypothetical protein